MPAKYWQIDTDIHGRDYADLFLDFGLACVGGLDAIASLKHVGPGDRILLKRGISEGIAVGEVVERNGRHRGIGDKPWLRDLDGLDLRGYCFVDWHVPSESFQIDGLNRASMKLIWPDAQRRLIDNLLSFPARSFRREPGPTSPVEDKQIIDCLLAADLHSPFIDRIMDVLRKTKRVARYYCKHAIWGGLRKDDARAFLIIPLMFAIGWKTQQLQISSTHSSDYDVADGFSNPIGSEKSQVIIKVIDFTSDLCLTPDQLRRYAKEFPECEALIVSNGWCYKAYLMQNDTCSFAQTPSAYLNVLSPASRYPLNPQQVDGSLGVLRQLIPRR